MATTSSTLRNRTGSLGKETTQPLVVRDRVLEMLENDRPNASAHDVLADGLAQNARDALMRLPGQLA
jgi:hypothetical protein